MSFMLCGTINIQLDVSMLEFVFFSLFVSLLACFLYCVIVFDDVACDSCFMLLCIQIYIYVLVCSVCVFMVLVLLFCKSSLMSHVLSVFFVHNMCLCVAWLLFVDVLVCVSCFV